MEYTFSDVHNWAGMGSRRLTAIVRQSTSDTISSIPVKPGRMRGYERQHGSIPRDDGILANSLVSKLDGGKTVEGESSHALVVGDMVAGDVARFGWTAEYARVQHSGGNGQTGTFWVTVAANRWQSTVARNVKRSEGIR